MADEQVIYFSPLMNWRVVVCSKMWGIAGYEVEKKYRGLWRTIYDGEDSLSSCFKYLFKNNIISKDEMKAQIQKWCK